MIASLTLLSAYIVLAIPAALIGLPWTLISGDIRFLYRWAMWILRTGLRMSGIRVEFSGGEVVPEGVACIFMSNHVSNLDPPIITPLIPRRTSVLVKKELFSFPILGRAMRMGSMVPVDRSNREAGIESVHIAKQVIQQGLNMTIYVEGKRSFDGKLLPFKKGPFYLAIECGVPVVPTPRSPSWQVSTSPGSTKAAPCPSPAARRARQIRAKASI